MSSYFSILLPSPLPSPLAKATTFGCSCNVTLQVYAPGSCWETAPTYLIRSPAKGLNERHLIAGLWMPFRVHFPITGVFVSVLSWYPEPPPSWDWGRRGGGVGWDCFVMICFLTVFSQAMYSYMSLNAWGATS